MTITFVNSAFATQSHTTSTPSCPIPTGAAAGDFAILHFLHDNGGTVSSVSPTDGEIGTRTTLNTLTQGMFGRVLTAGDISTGSITVTATGPLFTDLAVSVWRGVDNTTPYPASGGATNNSATSATATGLAVTADVNSCMLVRMSTEDRTALPSGMTNVYTYDGVNFLGDDQSVNSGSTGNKTSPQSASGDWFVSMVVLRPASVSGPTLFARPQMPQERRSDEMLPQQELRRLLALGDMPPMRRSGVKHQIERLREEPVRRRVTPLLGDFPPLALWGAIDDSRLLEAPMARRLAIAALQSGGAAISGSSSMAMSPFGAAATGLVTFAGACSAAMQSFAAGAAAAETFSASASAALQPFAESASGAETFTGSCSAAMAAFACTSSGAEAFAGSASAACSPFAASGNGATGTSFSGSCSAAASSFSASSSGAETFSGAASCTESSFAASAAGAEAFAGSGSAAVSPFAIAANGAVGTAFFGSASMMLMSFAISASGAEAFVGTGIAAVAPFAAVVSGNVALPINGSVAAALSSFALDGSGLLIVDIVADGTIAASPFGFAASGGLSGLYAPAPKLRQSPVFNLGSDARYSLLS